MPDDKESDAIRVDPATSDGKPDADATTFPAKASEGVVVPRDPQIGLRPGEAFIRSDIELSADYRKEYYKYALGISTALLAFTISFQPTLRTGPDYTWLEMAGWAALGVAVAAGLRLHMVWSKFYATTQKYFNKGLEREGREVRKRCNKERRVLEAAMLIGFVVGVASIIGFTAANLKNVALKAPELASIQSADAQAATTVRAQN